MKTASVRSDVLAQIYAATILIK